MTLIEDLKEENLDTLQKYGNEFQHKILSALLTDSNFLQQTSDIIHPHFFDHDSNKWIVSKILEYYHQFKNSPTMTVFKSELDKLDARDDIVKLSITEQLKGIHKNLKSSDLDYVKSEFLTFCKNQALKNAILRSADVLQRGKFDEIKGLIDRASRAGQEKNLGHEWSDNLEFRVTKLARDIIPTPWEAINDLLDGGLGPGELACIVAPSGIGKSYALCSIASEALRLNKKVVYYTLELSETYVGLRFDSIFSGIQPSEIKNNVEYVRNSIDKINGELIIKYYPTRTASADTIRGHINQLVQSDFSPDLIIIDYPDLMISTAKASARWEELGIIYEELRSVCGEMKIPMWVCSQSRRSAANSEFIETDDIAGAYAKIFVSDFVMSISRQLEDKVQNVARIHVMKNRFGMDGKVLAAHMDLSIGKIEIFDENSTEGLLLKDRLANGRAGMKQTLHKKFVSLYPDSK